MGYYTDYELQIGSWDENGVFKQVVDILDYPNVISTMNELMDYTPTDWGCFDITGKADGNKAGDGNEPEDVLGALSKKFPAVVLILYGRGERADDLWGMVAEGGKSERFRFESMQVHWTMLHGTDELPDLTPDEMM
ncbi:MAG: hypothetical protein ACXABY_11225 [Candidatus Thorarchaeota archaeon]|jgi:hypothetical protein